MGCGERKPKKELVRIVRTPEGEILLDTKGKVSGRGVYICHSTACLAKARKAKKFERSLETAIPDEVYETIAAHLADSLEGRQSED